MKNNTDKPKAYQQGWIEFYKLRFKLTEDVLIPRPETELLVDEVLNRIKNQESRIKEKQKSSEPIIHNSNFIILDIGTGSGNIAISIARNLPSNLEGCKLNVNIIATDVSDEALKVAKQNAKLHGVEDKIEFIQSDLLKNISTSVIPRSALTDRRNLDSAEMSKLFPSEIKIATSRQIGTRNDTNTNNLIIVTNLPYIPSARIPYLEKSVKDFEPHVALDGGEDGFELYRKLFGQIKEKGLNPNLILGEIDYTHGEIAKNEAEKYFPEAKVEVKTDLAHKQRILYINSF